MANQRIVSITTIDNEIDPIKDPVRWFMRDQELGYHTWSRINRIFNFDDNVSDEEQDAQIEYAIDWLVANDFSHAYRKIVVNET